MSPRLAARTVVGTPQPEAARRAELDRLQKELAGLQDLEEARRAAREEFDNYLATIDIFILNLDYAQAIRDLEALAEQLERLDLEDLLEIVQARLFDARGFDALFDRTLVRPWQTLVRVLRFDFINLGMNLPAVIARLCNAGLVRSQDGQLRTYAKVMVFGATVILVGLVMTQGGGA